MEINGLWDAVRTRTGTGSINSPEFYSPGACPATSAPKPPTATASRWNTSASPIEALIAYNTAMTADAGASEEIARQAALGVMRIHRADAEVQAAIAAWGAPDDNRDTPGFFRLREAASVAALFELSFGAGTPLPADFKEFLKYKGSH